MHKEVIIIVLNWDGLKDTLECLESVHKVDYPKFSVIVVDNRSVNDWVNIIRSAFPKVIMLGNKENLEFAGGNNVVIPPY